MGSLSGDGDTGPCLAIPKQSVLLQDGAHSGDITGLLAASTLIAGKGGRPVRQLLPHAQGSAS